MSDPIVRNELVPSAALAGLWDSVIVEQELKDRLVNQALLSLQLRPKVPFSASALHGLVLLWGPPGTGKTTLARGLAEEIAPLVSGGRVRLIEVDPHGLMSAEHGQSQQRVTELLCEAIPALCDDGVPSVVILDEVESMAVARSEASLAANPADVHRATDAVLMALDRNADAQPHILTVATSNFTEALDEAFRSRADLSLEVPLPDAKAAVAILRDALEGFARSFAPLGALASSGDLDALGSQLEGFDGRQIRKLVTEAMALRRDLVFDPGGLTIVDLAGAIRRARGEVSREGRAMKRHRQVAAAPLRSSGESWAVITELISASLDRSEKISAAEVEGVLALASGVGRQLVAAGHLDHRENAITVLASDLHLELNTVSGAGALSLDENLNFVVGAASAEEWTIHLPTPEPLGDAVRELAASVDHLSSAEPPAAGASRTAAEAGALDPAALAEWAEGTR